MEGKGKGDIWDTEKHLYAEGDFYAGNWSIEGRKHGAGYLKCKEGIEYRGWFDNDYYQGLGIITFQDGTKYEGEFKNGFFHGFGVYTRCDGMKFEGEFINGKAHGKGLLTFADGTSGTKFTYEGIFRGRELLQRCSTKEVAETARDMASKASKNYKELWTN